MKEQKFLTSFEAAEMDELVWDWLAHGIDGKARSLLQKTLLYDRRFREHFCEWIKAIRDPAWAQQATAQHKDTGDEKS